MDLNLTRPLKNNRGIALIMAISALALMIYIAMEVMYDTHVEYIVNSQETNRMKAYYAARGAVDLGLLRVKIYHNLQAKFGDKLGNMSAYVDEIWKFPFMWPPMIPESLSNVDKDQMQSTLKDSLMEASYTMSIQDEGSKMDLSDLVSPSEKLQKSAQTRLLNIFEAKKESSEEFRKKYENINFNQLIGQITDWMSSKKSSINGGDKVNPYRDYGADAAELPPNRTFRTLAEMKLIPMMNDDFYALLEPVVTLYGTKGVNPNTASKEILMALDSGITEEVAAAIENARSQQAFKDKDAFVDFLNKNVKVLNAKPDDLPISFDTVSSFSIRAIANYGDATREVQVITMDLNANANRIQTYLDEENKEKDKNPPSNPSPVSGDANKDTAKDSNKKKLTPLNGSPRVVYWAEK